MVLRFQRHTLREIAVGNRAEHATGFRHREHQIVDQLIHRIDAAAPGALRTFGRCAFVDRAVAADDLADPLQFRIHAHVAFDAIIERLRDLAVDAGESIGETRVEAAVTEGP